MTTPALLKFALQFPQGAMLFFQGGQHALNGVGDVYFLPRGGTDAFMLDGMQSSCAGETTLAVFKDKDLGIPPYDVVYRLDENGRPAAAQLRHDGRSTDGACMPDDDFGALQAAVSDGKIRLHDLAAQQPPRVFNIARFADGRLLVQLLFRAELYLGTPGNFQKLDVKLAGRQGNSRIYELPDGERIDLPWTAAGPGLEPPVFKGVTLQYLNFYTGDAPAKYGLDIYCVRPVCPFSPEIHQAMPDTLKPSVCRI